MQFQYVSRFPRYAAAASRHCNKRTDSAFWSGRFEPRPSVGRRLVGVGVGLKGGGGSEAKSCSINGRRAQVLPGRMQFTGAQSAQKAHNKSQDLTNNRSPPGFADGGGGSGGGEEENLQVAPAATGRPPHRDINSSSVAGVAFPSVSLARRPMRAFVAFAASSPRQTAPFLFTISFRHGCDAASSPAAGDPAAAFLPIGLGRRGEIGADGRLLERHPA